jgi:hypothetical protein
MSIPYRIEIKNLESGEIRMAPSFGVNFVNDDALKVWRERMCDCNLAAHFNRGWMRPTVEGRQEWTFDLASSGVLVSSAFIEAEGCDHKMPTTRFKAVALHLEDGRVLQV